jgi:hypothetical protein
VAVDDQAGVIDCLEGDLVLPEPDAHVVVAAFHEPRFRKPIPFGDLVERSSGAAAGEIEDSVALRPLIVVVVALEDRGELPLYLGEAFVRVQTVTLISRIWTGLGSPWRGIAANTPMWRSRSESRKPG